MPDLLFTHPRLAAIYDAVDGDRDDLEAYLAMATEFQARSVLDIGCGTGNLAVLLASRGLAVTGVDPAAASVEVARARPGAESVRWIVGPAAAALPLEVDLVTMTGNVAQVFLTDEEWSGVLGVARAALSGGGRLVFETRRPASRAWESWQGRLQRLEVGGVGTVEVEWQLTDVALPFVSFVATYRFAADGAVFTSASKLRFRDEQELRDDLAAAGFDVESISGAADRPGLEFVVVATAR